jgi:hypothetical protein
MLKIRICAVVLVLAISGCAQLPANLATVAKVDSGIDGLPCVGTVESVAPGLVEFGNAPLLTQAQRPSGGGYLCSAKSFAITQPVRLYRLIDSTQPYSKLGGFWSFDRPSGTRDDYRARFAICKQWSQLDRLIACDVRPGTVIVVGTTQSADCGQSFIYDKTAANQVFVPNDGRAEIVHTGACTDEGAWPPTSN